MPTNRGRDVCTLVRKDIIAVQHILTASEHDHTFTELITQKPGKERSTFVLNVYCRPKNKRAGLASLFHQVIMKAGTSPLLIIGDLNAAHPAWGYSYFNKRGKEVADCMDEENLTLLTNPAEPTRVGNSVSRDTCPDLTLAKNAPHNSWHNLEENLGSDHMIIETELQGSLYRRHLSEARITDWHNLRESRQQTPKDPIIDIENWAQKLRKTLRTTPESSKPQPRPQL